VASSSPAGAIRSLNAASSSIGSAADGTLDRRPNLARASQIPSVCGPHAEKLGAREFGMVAARETDSRVHEQCRALLVAIQRWRLNYPWVLPAVAI
jgi:hypothetical protein